MKLANVLRMAHSTPFKDEPLGISWEDNGKTEILWDENYRVGYVTKAFNTYRAEPYWALETHFFETLEEAKAWLLAMYRIGGKDEPIRGRRPAAK